MIQLMCHHLWEAERSSAAVALTPCTSRVCQGISISKNANAVRAVLRRLGLSTKRNVDSRIRADQIIEAGPQGVERLVSS